MMLFVATGGVLAGSLKSGLQNTVADEFGQLVGRRVTKALTPDFQPLGDFDNRFLHPVVRFLGTANEKHVLGLSDTAMAVIAIQPNTEQTDHRCFRFRCGSCLHCYNSQETTIEHGT